MTPPSLQPIGTPETVLAGLIGAGIGLSRTPAMQEAEGAAQGLRLVYRLFDTDRMDPPPLEELLRAAELCGFAGLNVTYPYKVAILDHLDTLSDEARALGAVNTVIFREGRRLGFNTDLAGFSKSFGSEMPDVARSRVLQLGAGGAGFAVAFGLMANKVGHLVIHDPDEARATALATAINARHGSDRASVAATLDEVDDHRTPFDGIVNASPIGMAKLPGTPYPLERLTPRMWVADVIYFPLETELLRGARALGCRTMGGAGMAVGQAAAAFEHFTGKTADPERMKARFLALGN
ncbi:shikimate dehydrogenase [Jiella marina]|uniref:shikimate dehydrogenase n=1 Tax=Jiella sp. LLJ827 TaxID=2917712 RepID=UPI002101CC2B|nr:shikimate dehydrogenase [Jiella sp. LLJ827]MCQ0988915.1 shikimate dehydrogenase [Jiella sp. LLJ827]